MRFVLSILRPMLTGLFAVLPLVITLMLVGWIASYVSTYLGPESSFGQSVARLGAVVVDTNLAYVIGLAIVLGALYFIGLIVQSRLRRVWSTLVDETLGRIPLFGTIYKTITRFVQLLDRKDDVDVQSMSPVWCYFSDDRRTAVLGLMPTAETIEMEGSTYRVVMIPTAPVPFGGGLFFLPAEWVQPAPFGVEGLTNIYVSMGVTTPDYMRGLDKAKAEPAQIIKAKPEQSEGDEPRNDPS
ncbi:MAG: DUF502 domain-containing protein [Pseudomonadota bacterium]